MSNLLGKPGETIAWQRWENDRPGRWSFLHVVAADGLSTRCGLRPDLKRYCDNDGSASDGLCRRCRRVTK